jgi:galactokinase
MSTDAARDKAPLFDRLDRALDAGGRASMHWFVPGRIEVLGKHTDYAGGRSLLCAVERGFCVGATPRADGTLRITDVVRGQTCELALSPDLEIPSSGWKAYAASVARRIARDFPGASTGADIALASDLPPAAGMSSSSALVVAIFAVLSAVNDLPARSAYASNIRTVEDLAGYLGCVENGQPFGTLAGGGGVGTFGGSEDHTAILTSEPGRLKQYAFCPVRRERTIALPPDWLFVVGVSGVHADKTGGARERYNRASRAVRLILDRWRSASGVRADTLASAIAAAPDAIDGIRTALWGLDDDREWLTNRLEQFHLESNTIVPEAADALARGDLARFGTLVDESQSGAERLLGNQVPETIALARTARELGAYAASAFGAGFGGSVWAMVAANEAGGFARRWRDAYTAASREAAARSKFFVSAAAPAMLGPTRS